MLCLELHLYLSHYSQDVINGMDFLDLTLHKYYRNRKNKQVGMRGSEAYHRPYGWHRFGLKVNMYLLCRLQHVLCVCIFDNNNKSNSITLSNRNKSAAKCHSIGKPCFLFFFFGNELFQR